jgi:WD40 repeat protein/Flp pilus assembly protein TadD
MGTTYEAEPLAGGPRVALKELHLSRVDDWKVMDLFEREARVLAALRHPSVPAYVDHFTIDDPAGPSFCLVQQLAPGVSLADLVASGWRADEAEAKRIAVAILDVLDHLHARVPPVYHRDIKPQNVIREPNGNIWLVDFGAVRDMYRSTAVGGSTVAGTFGYMAPEQLHGVARPESDLYGLGATLVYALSGRAPTEMSQTKLRVDFRPHVRASRGFAAWLQKVMEPAPEDRFPSAAAARRALDDPRQMQPVGSSGRRTAVLLGFLVALVATTGGFFAFERLRARSVKFSALAKLPGRPPEWTMPVVKWLRMVPAHLSAVKDVAFTPDGARLLSAGFDDTVKIWDARTGHALGALAGHTGRVAGVRVTRDGKFAVTGGDHTLRIWALPDGKPVRTFDTGSDTVYSIDVSPDGRFIANGNGSGQAKVWSFEGKEVATLAHGGRRVLSVAFAPDSSRIATAGEDKTIKVWRTSDWTLFRAFEGHTGAIDQAIIAPDGQLLASAGDDGTIRLWHVDSGSRIATLTGHTKEVWSLAFSPDGSTLVSGGEDAQLDVWDAVTTKLREKWPLDNGRKILGLTFSPDGATLASAAGNGSIDFWRLPKNGAHLPLPSPTLADPSATVPSTNPERRVYDEAMDLIENYRGDRHGLDEARAKLQGLVDSNPKSALGYAGLARVTFVGSAIMKDKYTTEGLAKTLELTSEAIARDKTLPDSYCTRGWAEYESKDAVGARAAAATALKLAPHMRRALSLATVLAQDDGDYDGAEKIIRTALAQTLSKREASGEFEALHNLYWDMGDFDACEQAHLREIELDPQSAYAKGNYAGFLIYKHDYDGAIRMSKQALSLMDYGAAKRRLSEAYCMQGEAQLWDQGDAAGATEAFARAAAADPTNFRSSYDQGALYQFEARGNAAPLLLALGWYRKAATLSPNEPLPKAALAAMGN